MLLKQWHVQSRYGRAREGALPPSRSRLYPLSVVSHTYHDLSFPTQASPTPHHRARGGPSCTESLTWLRMDPPCRAILLPIDTRTLLSSHSVTSLTYGYETDFFLLIFGLTSPSSHAIDLTPSGSPVTDHWIPIRWEVRRRAIGSRSRFKERDAHMC